MDKDPKDHITIRDDNGNEKEFAVEALFDMEQQSYALITGDEETLLMRVIDDEDEQYLVGITDPKERDAILDVYQVAVESENF
ncbi:DUF1292 domain-containing protein [Evansella sp. AB-P1]|uniref:DUF1292 domain-containing protein n=1 Tax=Evansella sp. AB-P1 TaxID=3037653 RepID=UPI00241C515D|nr:DUF1292 domain-containing protein [Evansella sp. AB-P1]MDG5789063.1 DUF1292 domain-containing protein [Evansella sp. AB-P1]